MPPPTPTNIYTDRAGLDAVIGSCGVDLRVNDSETTVVSAAEQLFIDYAINVASGEVDMYLANRYAPSALATSWVIYNWCSVLAAYRLTIRRCGSAPVALQFEYENVKKLMSEVQNGQLQIAGLPSLATPGCQFSNVRIDPRFVQRQMRVERVISDTTPTRGPQLNDIIGNWYGSGFYPM